MPNNKFTKTAKKNIEDYFKNNWKLEIGNTESARLTLYKAINKDFCTARHLHLPFHLRKPISKIRCSSHSLEIEKGRHKKLKIEDRTCKTWITAIESEEHLLLFCPDYSHHRLRYCPQSNSFLQWVEILKCDNKVLAFNLANFLTKGFK